MQRSQIRRHHQSGTGQRDQVRPESPCIQVCILGPDDVCTGCGRTRADIAQWSGMTAAEQWAVVNRPGLHGKM